MKTRTVNRLKFLASVLTSVIAGFAWGDLVSSSWSWADPFVWPKVIITLSIVYATGGYWLYTQYAGTTLRRDRFKVGLVCHVVAYGLTLLTLIVYALWHSPQDGHWVTAYLWWALVVGVHGILVRYIKDAPEDIFV